MLDNNELNRSTFNWPDTYNYSIIKSKVLTDKFLWSRSQLALSPFWKELNSDIERERATNLIN